MLSCFRKTKKKKKDANKVQWKEMRKQWILKGLCGRLQRGHLIWVLKSKQRVLKKKSQLTLCSTTTFKWNAKNIKQFSHNKEWRCLVSVFKIKKPMALSQRDLPWRGDGLDPSLGPQACPRCLQMASGSITPQSSWKVWMWPPLFILYVWQSSAGDFSHYRNWGYIFPKTVFINGNALALFQSIFWMESLYAYHWKM